jgi:serine protease Do
VNAKFFHPLLLLAVVAAPAVAQQSLESAFRTTGAEVTAAFEAQRAVLQTSSAVIQLGREQLAYGVVVSADGAILTKASEIDGKENLTVLVDRRTFRDVRVVATDPAWDVALLDVDADDLVPVSFIDGDSGEMPHGTWVVANGATSRFARRALAGVISAKARTIPAAGGAGLGMMLKITDDGLLVEGLVDAGGAGRAGLAVGDIIKQVGGKDVTNTEEIAKAIGDRTTGDTIEVKYLRNGTEATVEVVLTAREELFGEEMMSRNDQMSGDFSKRRSGFPRVIQHDILGNSSSVGGPLLDLDGRCLGMNIARANRAESFAIPVPEIREIADRLIQKR